MARALSPCRFALVGTLLLAASLAGCAEGEPAWPAKGMNLLVITLDTTRADALSCYGAPPGRTPAMDRLAERSVLFERAYSATNVTKPSHLSIMTGRRAIEHRVFSNHVLIPEQVEALPLYMKQKGYRTAGFVAAVQLGEETGWRGFDVIQGPAKGEAQRVAQEVVDDALAWLREQDGGPFFLWTHFFDPHTLYIPPKKFARRFYQGDWSKGDGPLIGEQPWFQGWDYEPMKLWIEGVRDPEFARGMYAGEVAYTDAQIGRMLSYLAQSGLEDETVVVLVADHGEHFGEHGLYYDHAGLYETALRIPLVIRVPGAAASERGTRSTELVTQLDILPTLSDLFGLGVERASGGRSLAPLLLDEPERYPSRDTLIFESAHNHQVAIRKGDWKLIWPIFQDHRFLGDQPELYDLGQDPEELHDLAESRPEVVEELRRQVVPWIETGWLARGELPTMSPEVFEQLESLGYLGDD